MVVGEYARVRHHLNPLPAGCAHLRDDTDTALLLHPAVDEGSSAAGAGREEAWSLAA